MSDAIDIRPATLADCAAIAAIYNEGIRDRVATLETEERNTAERAQWLHSRDARHPVFVADRDGETLGWGSINIFNPRPAYQHVADFSVYVQRDARGLGIGSKLLARIIEEAQLLNFHKLVLAAFPFNPAGMRLYHKFGFREVGIYREQGQLDGRWVDTIVMERVFSTPPNEA